MNSLVSIITPNFNRASIIEETLTSLLNQSYSNWEAIIVDDGSTDNSEHVILNYVSSDHRFKYFKRNRIPKGAPTCRNIGLEHATGEYVIFLDSDDLLAPFCLKQRVRYMEAHPQLDFAVFMGEQFNEKVGDRATLVNVPKHEDDIARFLVHDTPWITAGPIWRKCMLSNFRWEEDVTFFQDYLFNLLPIIEGYRYRFVVTEPDCYWRRGVHESISKDNKSIKRIESVKKVVDIVYDALQKKDLLKKYQNLIAGSYMDVVFRAIQVRSRKIANGTMREMKRKRLIDAAEHLFLQAYMPLFLASKNWTYWRILMRGMSVVIGKEKTYKKYETFGRVNKEKFYKTAKIEWTA